MQKDHKTVMYIIITIISVTIVAVGTVLILSSINNKSDDTNVENTAIVKESADNLKLQAVQEMNSDAAKAKQLLIEAREKYIQLGDQNAVLDIDSQLYYIENKM